MEWEEFLELALKHNTEIVEEYSEDCDFCVYEWGFENGMLAIITIYQKDKAAVDKALEAGEYDVFAEEAEQGDIDYDLDHVHFNDLNIAAKLIDAITDSNVKKIWIEEVGDWIINDEDQFRDYLDI